MRCLALLAVLAVSCRAYAQSSAERAQSEWNRMDEMANSLPAPENVGRNPAVDLAALQNFADYQRHLESVAKEFANEIEEDRQPFRNLGFKIEHLKSKLADFDRGATAYMSSEAIQNDLDHILKMAKRAVENQAPAYFRPENDIGRYTELVQLRISYLRARDPKSPALTSALEKLKATTAEVNSIKQSLSASILEQNEVPSDAYRGNDRESLLKILRDKWEKEGTKAKVLKVGIIAPNWKRDVTWEIQNRTIYKNDRSRIQGFVIVSHSDKIAVRHSINLIKDHIDNERISASFLDDPKAEPELTNQILTTKLK